MGKSWGEMTMTDFGLGPKPVKEKRPGMDPLFEVPGEPGWDLDTSPARDAILAMPDDLGNLSLFDGFGGE